MKRVSTLIGMKTEKYMGVKYVTQGREEDFRTVESLCERSILYFENGTSLAIWEESDICPSGWTTCTYGRHEWREKTSHKMSGLKGGPIEVTIEEDKWGGITLKSSLNGKEVATVDRDGGDKYYPAGFVYLDLELFK